MLMFKPVNLVKSNNSNNSQKAVSAYFISEQIHVLPFAIAEQFSRE